MHQPSVIVAERDLVAARRSGERLAWPFAVVVILGLSASSWLAVVGLHALLFR